MSLVLGLVIYWIITGFLSVFLTRHSIFVHPIQAFILGGFVIPLAVPAFLFQKLEDILFKETL